MGILDALSGIVDFGMQMDTQRYNKMVQEKTWEREDNSVQRRVADLKAAGLSPVLAAGSGASSSAPIQVGTPQLDMGESEQAAMALMRSKQDIATSAAQKELINQQRENANKDLSIKAQDERRLKAEADKAKTEADILKRELALREKVGGFYYGNNGIVGQVSQALGGALSKGGVVDSAIVEPAKKVIDRLGQAQEMPGYYYDEKTHSYHKLPNNPQISKPNKAGYR